MTFLKKQGPQHSKHMYYKGYFFIISGGEDKFVVGTGRGYTPGTTTEINGIYPPETLGSCIVSPGGVQWG